MKIHEFFASLFVLFIFLWMLKLIYALDGLI